MHPRSRMIAALVSRGILVLAAGPLGACFDFDATSVGGPLDALPDAAAPPTLVDGGSDVTVTLQDATLVPSDAGDATLTDADATTPPRDAGHPGLDAGHSFCAAFAHSAAKLFFCDDFDEQPLPGAWNSFGEMGGTLADTDASPFSSPTSLDEKLQALAFGAVLNVALRETLVAPTFPSTLRFAFEIEPTQIDTTENAAVVLGAVDFLDNAGNRYTLGLAINVASGAPALALGEQSSFEDGGALFSNHQLPPTQPLSMNAWSNLTLEIDWVSATNVEALVSVNGGQELDVQLTVTVQPTSLQVGVGTSYVSEPSPVWELRYDNVVFTAE
jgi:hypothetical protein